VVYRPVARSAGKRHLLRCVRVVSIHLYSITETTSGREEFINPYQIVQVAGCRKWLSASRWIHQVWHRGKVCHIHSQSIFPVRHLINKGRPCGMGIIGTCAAAAVGYVARRTRNQPGPRCYGALHESFANKHIVWSVDSLMIIFCQIVVCNGFAHPQTLDPLPSSVPLKTP